MLPFPSLSFPSLPFPSLPFPSLPFPSLPFPSPPCALPQGLKAVSNQHAVQRLEHEVRRQQGATSAPPSTNPTTATATATTGGPGARAQHHVALEHVLQGTMAAVSKQAVASVATLVGEDGGVDTLCEMVAASARGVIAAGEDGGQAKAATADAEAETTPAGGGGEGRESSGGKAQAELAQTVEAILGVDGGEAVVWDMLQRCVKAWSGWCAACIVCVACACCACVWFVSMCACAHVRMCACGAVPCLLPVR